jgi:hypothetical protein
MRETIIIQSNGSGKEKLDARLKEGWRVVSVTSNDCDSYNDFVIVIEKED